MIRGKYYIKMIALGLVIGIVLALAGIFGGQLYHKTMAEKCIDKYNETGTEVNAQSQIVSLSTCTNVREDERFLLQGVLTATDGGEN